MVKHLASPYSSGGPTGSRAAKEPPLVRASDARLNSAPASGAANHRLNAKGLRDTFVILIDRRTARHDQHGHQNLDDIFSLVAGLAADRDHAAVGAGPRWLDLDDLALDPQDAEPRLWQIGLRPNDDQATAPQIRFCLDARTRSSIFLPTRPRGTVPRSRFEQMRGSGAPPRSIDRHPIGCFRLGRVKLFRLAIIIGLESSLGNLAPCPHPSSGCLGLGLAHGRETTVRCFPHASPPCPSR
jgi:hypothetical protein